MLSRGVHAGVECTNEEWETIVRSTPLEGYLLQEFYRPFVTENYGIGPDGTFGRNRITISPVCMCMTVWHRASIPACR